MIVQFRNKKLKSELQDLEHLSKRFDAKEVESIIDILTRLEEVQFLSELPRNFRCHPLKGKMKGRFAIDVPATGKRRGGNRLVLQPTEESSNETDPRKVSHILILGIGDYHK
ncbi:MAG: hypothetical protein F4X82_01500 [Candidatus Spechtbacteria bacterium SB0662_bin_43]|uniref:Uncharacterized protein n=1 Tax=Candidatus Spechtbacteria bacterium SB0662_bin_43 TaxID=2604897 RepID=A0A845DAV4_9BACT|nr:hypothetical protein [Candidatus Spechtbacteria bacterium SB0662_bin_43]